MDPGVALLAVVAVVVAGIALWAGRKRFPLRIGFGNFFRRKTQVAIVVAGLLIGTAIISSSYVIQSTFDYTIRSTVFHNLDYIDEIIALPTPEGGRAPFPASVFTNLQANLSAMPAVAALAPRFQLSTSAFDRNSSLLEPTATVIGFNATQDLGRFVRSDGTSWDGSGLRPGEAIVNGAFANDTEAKLGDSLVLYLGVGGNVSPLLVRIHSIVLDSGRGAYNGNPDVFLPLAAVQAALGQLGMINVITVANVGGPTQGYLHTDAVDAQLQAHLDPGLGLSISNVKADQVSQATQNVDQLGQIFILLGSFTIVAGVLLIINIFVMLAEERKGEMGVARALGMRRAHLVQSFVSEGLLYALLSAAVGTLAGLGLAAAILWAFTLVFPASVFGGITFVLTWTPLDLIRGFAIGFLITMGTIALASWRVSKLNIVRAIRDIPEPVPRGSTGMQLGIGGFLAVLGALLTVAAVVRSDPLLQDLGPSSLVFGLAVLLMRILSPRIVFSAAGGFMVIWLLLPNKPIAVTGADIDAFVAAGLLLVFGALLIVLFNSETLLAVATRFIRRRTWLPVVRTAIAYPMNKKFRTGITLATIALIMFTIATMSGIQTQIGSSISTTTIRQSGGYDLIAQTNPAIPKPSFWTEYAAANVSQNLTAHHGLSWVRIQASFNATLGGTEHGTSLLGVPQEWVNASVPLELQSLDPAYPSAQAAWQALESNPDLAIADGSVAGGIGFGAGFTTYHAKVGDTLYYRNATGAIAHVTLIGILYEQFVPGLFVGWNTVQTAFHVDYPSIFYFTVKPGQDATAVGHDLERTFLKYQMITFDLQSFVDQITGVVTGIFNLLTAYLALGLIVGIAGLGVITMRNVVERRAETGALRALGFRKSMVLKSYLLELSFLALTGILMGDVLGVALSYDLYLKFFSDLGYFSVPWLRLAVLSAAAFVGAVVATASPAIRAARMPPAEALRSYE